MRKASFIVHSFRGPIASLALGMALSGCAPSTTYLDPGYTREEFKEGPVAFMPMRFTEIGMEAFEEFRKAFKNEPDNGGETKLAEAFNKGLLSAAKMKVKEIRILDSGSVIDPYRQYETKQLLNKGQKSQSAMRIVIPMKSTVDSITPPIRFLITARNVNFTYKVEEQPDQWRPGTAISTPTGKIPTAPIFVAGGKSKVITLSMSYMIWDYKNDAPVSYGKYTTDMSATFFFTQGEWLRMMESAGRAIAQNTP